VGDFSGDHVTTRSNSSSLTTPANVVGQGSLSWGGINNTYFWVRCVILMQFLPFADPKALAVYDAFKRTTYQLADAQ
jgi:hypothetical protein